MRINKLAEHSIISPVTAIDQIFLAELAVEKRPSFEIYFGGPDQPPGYLRDILEEHIRRGSVRRVHRLGYLLFS